MNENAYEPRDYPPFAVTVDVVLMTVVDGELRLLLIQRGIEPFKDSWALPGGFVLPEEDLDHAASRELLKETGIHHDQAHMEQLGAYGRPGRDPRMRVVTVAYWAVAPQLREAPKPSASLYQNPMQFAPYNFVTEVITPKASLDRDPLEPRAGTDAAHAEMVRMAEIQSGRLTLAFDHRRIANDAVNTLRARLETTTLAHRFCPPEFTIRQLQAVYEAVWNTELDAGNFYRDMTHRKGFLIPVEGRTPSGERGGRPARLWKAGESSNLDRPYYRSPGRIRREGRGGGGGKRR